MRHANTLALFIVYSLIGAGYASAGEEPTKGPGQSVSNPNPCPTNDSVCAKEKAKELAKASKEHEAKMEELKALALAKP
jgi:hypothetical protein